MSEMFDFMRNGGSFSTHLFLMQSQVSGDTGLCVQIGTGYKSAGWFFADGFWCRRALTRFRFDCKEVTEDRIHYQITVADGDYKGACVIVDTNGHLIASHTSTPPFLKVELGFEDELWFNLRDARGYTVRAESFNLGITEGRTDYVRVGVGLDANLATFRFADIQRGA